MKKYLDIFLGIGVLSSIFYFANFLNSHSDNNGAQVTPNDFKNLSTFNLTEVSKKTGVSTIHKYGFMHPSLANVEKYFSQGASIAVADYDNDDQVDIYVTNSALGEKNHLFHNNGNGTFVDLAEKANLADVNRESVSLRPLFFDFDNDGFKDLFISTSYCPKLFHNNQNGTFSDISNLSGVNKYCFISTASNVIDFDKDGFLDLILAAYNKPIDLTKPIQDWKFMPNSGVNADNGGPIIVLRNNQNGTFSPVKGNLGIKSKGWTLSVGVYDLRNSGNQDIWFATDYNSDQLYLNQGKGIFKNASDQINQKFGRNGMSAEIADIDNDERPTIFVSNIFEPGIQTGQNLLWKWEEKEKFQNIAQERNIEHCGWAWGAKFLDLDNDSFQDLVVTNGFFSGNPSKSYWYKSTILFSAAGKFLEDSRNWPPIGDAHMATNQRKCVFKNMGKNFSDITESTPLIDDRYNGRAIATIDYMNNGSLSFLVAHQEGPLFFYNNEQKNNSNWIGFKLIGTQSNRDALGTKIKVYLKDKTLSKDFQPMNGFCSQSDGRVHFGLGEENVNLVEITWPSGIKQTFNDLKSGRYHTIIEKGLNRWTQSPKNL